MTLQANCLRIAIIRCRPKPTESWTDFRGSWLSIQASSNKRRTSLLSRCSSIFLDRSRLKHNPFTVSWRSWMWGSPVCRLILAFWREIIWVRSWKYTWKTTIWSRLGMRNWKFLSSCSPNSSNQRGVCKSQSLQGTMSFISMINEIKFYKIINGDLRVRRGSFWADNPIELTLRSAVHWAKWP